MTSSRSAFIRAITSYEFPRAEPIFSIDLNWTSGARCRQVPCLFVFRPAGPEAEWHRTIEDFWASALFNFLEDCLDDSRFEELGAAGKYQALADDEARRILGNIMGASTSDSNTFPLDPTTCYLVYNDPDLMALVGTDSAGFFAVIWKCWDGG